MGKLAAVLFACGLVAAPALANCVMEKAVSLPMQVENGLIFVAGEINGHPTRFLVNSLTDSAILPDAARNFDLYQVLSPNLRSFTYSEEGGLGPVRIKDFRLGGLALPDTLLHVLGRRPNLGAEDEIAVLGRDLLRRYEVEFDPAHHLLTLYHSSGCADANLAFWTDHTNMLPMLEGDDLLHYRIGNFNQHIVEMKGVFVATKVNGQDAIAVLDSASAQSGLTVAAANSFNIPRLEPAVERADNGYSLLYNRIRESWPASIDRLTLDQESLHPFPVMVQRVDSADDIIRFYAVGTKLLGRPIFTADLVLGADFLLSHHVLLSYSQRKLYFSYGD